MFAFSNNDFVAQMRLFVEVLLVQTGRVCLTLTDPQGILKLGGVDASLHVLSVPILQQSPLRAADGLPPFPSDVQASLQAADHVLLQPQVQVEGEVEPGGLVNLPRYAAQAVSSVALNLHRNIEEIIKI